MSVALVLQYSAVPGSVSTKSTLTNAKKYFLYLQFVAEQAISKLPGLTIGQEIVFIFFHQSGSLVGNFSSQLNKAWIVQNRMAHVPSGLKAVCSKGPCLNMEQLINISWSGVLVSVGHQVNWELFSQRMSSNKRGEVPVLMI